jgi:hypothetical protein
MVYKWVCRRTTSTPAPEPRRGKGVATPLVSPSGWRAGSLIEMLRGRGRPGPPERVAALKRWVDTYGHVVAYLHLPTPCTSTAPWEGGTCRDRASPDRGAGARTSSSWTRSVDGPGRSSPTGRRARGAAAQPARLAAPGVTGSVRPDDGETRQMSNQDAINKYRTPGVIRARGFRQRWAIGIDIPRPRDGPSLSSGGGPAVDVPPSDPKDPTRPSAGRRVRGE